MIAGQSSSNTDAKKKALMMRGDCLNLRKQGGIGIAGSFSSLSSSRRKYLLLSSEEDAEDAPLW